MYTQNADGIMMQRNYKAQFIRRAVAKPLLCRTKCILEYNILDFGSARQWHDVMGLGVSASMVI